MNKENKKTYRCNLSKNELQELTNHIATKFRLMEVVATDFTIWTDEYSFDGISSSEPSARAKVSVVVTVDEARAMLDRSKWVDQLTW